MSDNITQNLMGLFGVEAPQGVGSPVVGGGGLAPRRVGAGEVAAGEEEESDVLSLIGNASSTSSVVRNPVPAGLSHGTLVAAFAFSSGAERARAYNLFKACEGMKAADLRAFCLAMANATQPLNRGDIIGDLGSFETVAGVADKCTPQDILAAMKVRANKMFTFVAPSAIVSTYVRLMNGKFRSLMPDRKQNVLVATLGDGTRRVLPNTDAVTDELVAVLIGDMRTHLDGAYETCALLTECLIRLSVYLHPVVIQGNKLVAVDSVLHERYVRDHVSVAWKTQVLTHGKQGYALVGAGATLTKVVNGRLVDFLVPEGADKKNPFLYVLQAVVRRGTAQFNSLWATLQPVIEADNMVFNLSEFLSSEKWNNTPVMERIGAIAKNGWLPINALKVLDAARTARASPILEKLTACVDQPGFSGDSSVSQQDKIAKLWELMKVPAAECLPGQMKSIGIDMGYTVPYLGSRGFEFYDLKGKEVFGHTVHATDVNNTLRLRGTLKGAKVLLSDVAAPTTGKAQAGSTLERCSYVLNELGFSNLVNGCVEAGVKYIGLKSFLPNSNVANGDVPLAVQVLVSHYEVRAYKLGKLHNDEIFYVGSMRPRKVEVRSVEYLETMKKLVLDFGLASYQCVVGNRLIGFALSTGSVGPKWREGATLEVNWTGKWRPANLGERGLYEYTHVLAASLTTGLGSLPLFGANRDLFIEQPQEEDNSLTLYKLFSAAAATAASIDAHLSAGHSGEVPGLPHVSLVTSGDKEKEKGK